MLIDCLEALECYRHKIRAVPLLLFLGRQKYLDLNSINFGNPEYTDLNTIRNQISISLDIVRSFVTSRKNFQLLNYVSHRRVLTSIPLPIPIVSRACLPFFSMYPVRYVTNAVSLP